MNSKSLADLIGTLKKDTELGRSIEIEFTRFTSELTSMDEAFEIFVHQDMNQESAVKSMASVFVFWCFGKWDQRIVAQARQAVLLRDPKDPIRKNAGEALLSVIEMENQFPKRHLSISSEQRIPTELASFAQGTFQALPLLNGLAVSLVCRVDSRGNVKRDECYFDAFHFIHPSIRDHIDRVWLSLTAMDHDGTTQSLPMIENRLRLDCLEFIGTIPVKVFANFKNGAWGQSLTYLLIQESYILDSQFSDVWCLPH